MTTSQPDAGKRRRRTVVDRAEPRRGRGRTTTTADQLDVDSSLNSEPDSEPRRGRGRPPTDSALVRRIEVWLDEDTLDYLKRRSGEKKVQEYLREYLRGLVELDKKSRLQKAS